VRIGEEWAVDYRATDSPYVTAVERPGNRLLVFGNTDNADACKAALRRWLNRKTHEHIKEWVERLAEDGEFELRRVLVKSQRTRWASCSKNKTISLNLKLLFIPADLIRYALIHELCHTERMNHSKEFWASFAATSRTTAGWTTNSAPPGATSPPGSTPTRCAARTGANANCRVLRHRHKGFLL